MVYNWDDKEAECHRLYVGERKSLDQVMAYWELRGFTPSKRAFQTQFKRWDFPSKQNPAYRNPVLVARLQELWEQNHTQKDMVDMLQAEGHQISDRELIRLRLKLKLFLRESAPRPKRKQPSSGAIRKKQQKKNAGKVVPGGGTLNELANALLAEESSSAQDNEVEHNIDQEQLHDDHAQETLAARSEPTTTPLNTAEAVRKQLRQEQLQIESDEKWRTRKRRRRTRGWAGLPADAPGEPPRFPSETTLDEAKAYLELDNDMYKKIRERFLEICKEHGVVKKTISGPEKWTAVVQQLIKEDTHLCTVFEQEPLALQTDSDALFRPKGQRALSLDVICMDVTKRLRTMESRMTLAEAKNILCLNPEQTRKVRNALSARLRADHFTNKFETGEEHWTMLKQAWVTESEYLTRALALGEADPDYARKSKAVEVLARDVTKRLRTGTGKHDLQKKAHQGPGPGPAPPTVAPHLSTPRNREHQARRSESIIDTAQRAQTTMPVVLSSDLQIDPSLLLAASDAAILPTPTYQPSHHQYEEQDDYQYHRSSSQPHRSSNSTYQHYSPESSSSYSMPLPVYFRLNPHSSTPFPSKAVWLSILHTASIAELENLAVREHPGTMIYKIEGMITYGGGQEDREVTVEVSDDAELGAYLSHVRGEGGAQGKATFVVLLGSGGAYT